MSEIIRGTVEPLGVVYERNGALVTGLGNAALYVAISRSSDGKLFDFSDLTFKTVPVTGTHALTELGGGVYEYAWDTGAITNAVAAGTDESYSYIVTDTVNGNTVDADEVRVRGLSATYALASTAATQATAGAASAATAATQASAGATSAAAAATSAATAVTQTAPAALGTAVWTTPTTRTLSAAAITASTFAADAITAAALAADAVTEVQNGLATATGLASLQTHGDATWITAAGFAVAGDAMALTSSERTTLGGVVAPLVWAAGTRTLSAATNLSALASQASVDALATAVGALPSAAAISTQVAVDLASTHGAGSWLTANIASLATASALSTVAANVVSIMGTGYTSGVDDLHSLHTLAAGAATGAALTTAIATIDGHTDTGLTALQLHGDSAWATANLAGLATAAGLASLQTHGDSTWATAAIGTLATSTALAAAQTSLDAIQGTSFSTTTDSLHALRARGDAAWVTANVSPLATASALAALQTDVTAVKGTSFTTGDDLHSIAAAVAAGSAPSAATIAAAVAAYDISTNSNPLQLGGALTLVRRFTTWTPSTLNHKVWNVGTGKVDVYNDGGTAALYSVPAHDASGGAVSPAAGDPWKVGV